MNIKKVIKQKGWTMERLASAMGITQPSVSSIINGNPSLSRLQEIANVIGVSLSELVSDDDSEQLTALIHYKDKWFHVHTLEELNEIVSSLNVGEQGF